MQHLAEDVIRLATIVQGSEKYEDGVEKTPMLCNGDIAAAAVTLLTKFGVQGLNWTSDSK